MFAHSVKLDYQPAFTLTTRSTWIRIVTSKRQVPWRGNAGHPLIVIILCCARIVAIFFTVGDDFLQSVKLCVSSSQGVWSHILLWTSLLFVSTRSCLFICSHMVACVTGEHGSVEKSRLLAEWPSRVNDVQCPFGVVTRHSGPVGCLLTVLLWTLMLVAR